MMLAMTYQEYVFTNPILLDMSVQLLLIYDPNSCRDCPKRASMILECCGWLVGGCLRTHSLCGILVLRYITSPYNLSFMRFFNRRKKVNYTGLKQHEGE